MREIRPSGSEGGGTGQPVLPTPIALSIFKVLRDSSSSANKNGGLLGMTGQRSFSAACKAPPFRPC